MKFKLKYLSVLFALFIIIAVLPQIASAAPIVWFQSSSTANFTDFNGCVDNPITPNPIQVKDTPINFVNPVSSGHQILVFVHADRNVSLGGCVALVSPWITSITDNVGTSYVKIGNYIPNQATIFVQWEIWYASSANANAQNLVVHMGNGKLNVAGLAYDFSGLFSYEFFSGNTNGLASTSGDTPFAVTWNNTAGVYLTYSFSSNAGGCNGNEPNCIFPASSANAGTGGFNENNLTVACPIPPPGGCAANINSNSKPGGGDNNSGTTPVARIQTARITSILAGAHTFYWHTNSPQSSTVWFFGFMLYPLVNPNVTTLPADNIGIDNARLNGNLIDLGISASVNVWFMYGDTTGLGNNTSAQAMTTTGVFSQIIYQLFSNHTYYFTAHAENITNQAYANGSMLNFTSAVNNNLVNFIAYGWVFGFLAALILGMIGAYWIKKKRDEH